MKRRDFIALTLPAHAQSITRLSITVPDPGGVAFRVGGTLAALISKHIPGVTATAEVVGSAAHSVMLLEAGKAALGINISDIPAEANAGRLRGMARKASIRAIAGLATSHFYLVTLEESGIRSASDLKGKRVSTGPPGGGTEFTANAVLRVGGLSVQDLRSRERLGLTEAAGGLKDRKLDAFFWTGTTPIPAIMDLASTPGLRIRLIPTADALDKPGEKSTAWFRGVIPGGAYKGWNIDTPAIAQKLVLMSHERLPDKIAYGIARLLHERSKDMAAIHKAFDQSDVKNAVAGIGLPFHPGAARFYREKGAM